MEKGRVRSLDSTICIKQCLIQRQLAPERVQGCRNVLILPQIICVFFVFFSPSPYFPSDGSNCSCGLCEICDRGNLCMSCKVKCDALHFKNICHIFVITDVLNAFLEKAWVWRGGGYSQATNLLSADINFRGKTLQKHMKFIEIVIP